MEVSRLTLSPALRNQVSTKEIILRWMQQNPNKTKNTNIQKMAKQITIPGGTLVNTRQHLYQMVDNQMISRFGTRNSSKFSINYLHKDIPKSVLENAPKEDMRLFKNTLQSIKEGKRLTADGCLSNKKEEQKEQKQPKPKQTETLSVTITININNKTGELNVQTKN